MRGGVKQVQQWETRCAHMLNIKMLCRGHQEIHSMEINMVNAQRESR
jgi:hypothetical protein